MKQLPHGRTPWRRYLLQLEPGQRPTCRPPQTAADDLRRTLDCSASSVSAQWIGNLYGLTPNQLHTGPKASRAPAAAFPGGSCSRCPQRASWRSSHRPWSSLLPSSCKATHAWPSNWKQRLPQLQATKLACHQARKF